MILTNVYIIEWTVCQAKVKRIKDSYERQKKALDQLELNLTESPVEKIFYIRCNIDASEYSILEMLSQEGHPIMFL